MRPGARPRARQARAGLVLDVGAQDLCGAAVLGLDVDAREVEAVARRRRAAVDAHRHVVPARARHVLPAHVADGQARGVAVLVRVWTAGGLVLGLEEGGEACKSALGQGGRTYRCTTSRKWAG